MQPVFDLPLQQEQAEPHLSGLSIRQYFPSFSLALLNSSFGVTQLSGGVYTPLLSYYYSIFQ